MEFKPHNYQKKAKKHILDNNRCALFKEMGLGKTVTTLSAIVELIDGLEVRKVLIVSPKMVTESTWPEEIRKWGFSRHLKFSLVVGDAKKRKLALMKNADIYLISRDNIAWLVEETKGAKNWDFDMLVIDELSSFKSNASRRFKALRKVIHLCHRVVGLTGTPAPNSLEDLWSQVYLLDRGERLGRTISQYREAYFRKKYNGFGWEIREGCDKHIHKRVGDICLSMQAKDYLDLPKRVDITRTIKLERMDKYKEFVREEVLKLESGFGEEITPMSAAALYNKLLQFCNGAVYDENKNVHEVDSTKLMAIKEAVDELQGQPCLIFYQFQSDIYRLRKEIPQAQVLQGAETIVEWNKGNIPVLLLHAASAGHGLNMQHGGHHMFWYGLPWGLELYQQAVARLDRQGQTKPVINVRFICEGTVEELVATRLEEKRGTQEDLIQALKKHVL